MLVRPSIDASKWSESNQILNLEGDQLNVKQARNWTVTVPGRLGRGDINFFSVEKDVGPNLVGESNRCMILAEGAATSRALTKLLEGYMHNSTIKLHFDLFQMTLDGPMPQADNGEIVSDMPARSQPMSYHYGLLSAAATVQPMDPDLGVRSDSTQAASKLRQTEYGHRGDAHIGEASHPGPKRMSHTDAPDVDAVWACGMCTSWNHEYLKSCETCGSVKRPRCTTTGVSAATQTHSPNISPGTCGYTSGASSQCTAITSSPGHQTAS